MRKRCQDERNIGFAAYGGRGIRVCDRWDRSFANFLADMGERPDGTSLDRINTNGHYEPGNCRWADIMTQNSNTRSARLLTYDGCTLTVNEWARRLNMVANTIHKRLDGGASVYDALFTPIDAKKSHKRP
jgi:hypothetical protein